MSTTLRMRALDHGLNLARGHVREQGANNRGPAVDRIIRYAGGDLGEPWCVDTVIWCYGHAGSTVVRLGFPRAVRLMAPHAGIKPVGPRSGRPGDVVRYTFDHTGLVIGYRRYVAGRLVRCPARLATHVLALEGNTGPGQLSDSAGGGDVVDIKLRALALVQDCLQVKL